MACCIKWKLFISVLLLINSLFAFFGVGYYYKSGHVVLTFMLITIGCTLFSSGLAIFLNWNLAIENTATIKIKKTLKSVRFSSLLQIYEDSNLSLDENSNTTLDEDSNRSLDEDSNRSCLDDSNWSLDDSNWSLNDDLSIDEDSYRSLDGYSNRSLDEDSNCALLKETENADRHRSAIVSQTNAGNICSKSIPQVKCSQLETENADRHRSAIVFQTNTGTICSKSVPQVKCSHQLETENADRHKSAIVSQTNTGTICSKSVPQVKCSQLEIGENDQYMAESDLLFQAEQYSLKNISLISDRDQKAYPDNSTEMGENVVYGAIRGSNEKWDYKEHKDVHFFTSEQNKQCDEVSDDEIHETAL